MSAKNDSDIEIGGNKVETAVSSDKVESLSKSAEPGPATDPIAIVVVAAAKTDTGAEAVDLTDALTTNPMTNGNTNPKTIAVAAATVNGESASELQEQPKQESTVMQPKPQQEQSTKQPVVQSMQQSIAGKMDEDASLTNFKVLYVVTQLCGLTMIILVGSWVGIHFGGVGGTDNPKLEFNWHPLLMTIGLIFLYGNSILVYRGFRNVRKKTLKLTHAGVHLAAFILTVIALKTVFDSHNLAPTPIPNMYSLHSWLGLGAVIIFSMQYVAGFTAYLAPGLRQSLKVAYMPLHIYFGLLGFVLAIASALMGITEKALFSIPDYSSLPNAGVMANCIGGLYVIFGAMVVYLATETAYKRKPLPEDVVLLTGVNE